MKKITKITFTILAIILVFAACSKRDDTIPSKVAEEITSEELADYFIIEEYTTKPEYSNANGQKPILICTRLQHIQDNHYMINIESAASVYSNTSELSYNSKTGITKLTTPFGDYELTRDDKEQIIVKKSNHKEESTWSTSKYFNSSYIQLVKTTDVIYYNNTYKEVSGTGYYSFSTNYWRYKQGAHPTLNELTWTYTQYTNTIWRGQDGGSAQYHNLFLILTRGNGWKEQHKDKDLLIVNTLDKNHFKAVGDIGIYTIDN